MLIFSFKIKLLKYYTFLVASLSHGLQYLEFLTFSSVPGQGVKGRQSSAHFGFIHFSLLFLIDPSFSCFPSVFIHFSGIFTSQNRLILFKAANESFIKNETQKSLIVTVMNC